MAYLGIVGPYSTGKTTATDGVVQWLGDNQHLPVVVVNCDNNLEREWFKGRLEEGRYRGRTEWKGKVDEKREALRYCIKRRIPGAEAIWLCETAWADHIRLAGELAAEMGGGAELIVLTCAPDVYCEFLIARCAKRNKQFRADYWTMDRLGYEGTRRFLNAARRYLDPAGVPWHHFEVDPKREIWDDILELIRRKLVVPVEEWYN